MYITALAQAWKPTAFEVRRILSPSLGPLSPCQAADSRARALAKTPEKHCGEGASHGVLERYCVVRQTHTFMAIPPRTVYRYHGLDPRLNIGELEARSHSSHVLS